MDANTFLAILKTTMPLITAVLVGSVGWLIKTVLKKQDIKAAEEIRRELKEEIKELQVKNDTLQQALYTTVATKRDMELIRDKVDALTATILAFVNRGDSK